MMIPARQECEEGEPGGTGRDRHHLLQGVREDHLVEGYEGDRKIADEGKIKKRVNGKSRQPCDPGRSSAEQAQQHIGHKRKEADKKENRKIREQSRKEIIPAPFRQIMGPAQGQVFQDPDDRDDGQKAYTDPDKILQDGKEFRFQSQGSYLLFDRHFEHLAKYIILREGYVIL
jgi:hypothetical protein